MFERFTSEARDVVVATQEEARGPVEGRGGCNLTVSMGRGPGMAIEVCVLQASRAGKAAM